MTTTRKTKTKKGTRREEMLDTQWPGLSRAPKIIIILIIFIGILFIGFKVYAIFIDILPNKLETTKIMESKMNIADRCLIKYTLSGNNDGIIIKNSTESKISIGTPTGIINNNIASCYLERSLSNEISTYSGTGSIYPRVEIGGTGMIYYKDIISGASLQPLYHQNIGATIVCTNKESSERCSSDSIDLSYDFPKVPYSGKFLIIDGSENDKKEKPIIIELRKILSGIINSDMKVMWPNGLRNENNVIFFNPNKYSGKDDILKDIKEIIEKTISQYNNIPFILVPMTSNNYKKEIQLWYLNDCTRNDKRACVTYKYSEMNNRSNVYDLRFLDEKSNYDLDFWIFLASPK